MAGVNEAILGTIEAQKEPETLLVLDTRMAYGKIIIDGLDVSKITTSVDIRIRAGEITQVRIGKGWSEEGGAE